MAKPCDEPKLISRGRYQICMELASGEESTIYLALYRAADGFERVVVVKRIHAALSSKPNFATTLFHEAQALARVSHPTLCRLLDVGLLEDSYFLVMDYVEGESIQSIQAARERLKAAAAERLPLIAARVFAKLCEGLHAVHEARADLERKSGSQRVLTPRNLFVLYDGSVRLLDFAVAAPHGMLHRTKKGMIKEQLAYMAPEHFAEGEIDRRADIWSVGVALWELLTGRRLFDAGLINDTLQSVNKKRVVAPSALNRHVPAALDEIVLRSLERDVTLRQQSARELSDTLEAFLATAGEAVAPGHIAAWLDGLFPGQADQKRGLRCVAQTIGERLGPPSLRVRQQQVASEAGSAEAGPSTQPQPISIAEAAREERADFRRKRGLMLAGAAVSGALVSAALMLLELGPASQPPVAASGPATPVVALTAQPTAQPDAPAQPPAPPASVAPAAATQTRASAAPATAEAARAANPRAPRASKSNRARSSPPPAAAGPVLGEGYVYLMASPGSATILWEGRTLGRTPMRVRLPAGTHRLELRPIRGGESVPVEVTIKAGQGALASITLPQ